MEDDANLSPVVAPEDMETRCRRSWEAFEAASHAVGERADASYADIQRTLTDRLSAAGHDAT